ncbi:biotin/lipoyl-binding protein [Roseimicrobium sp. ORNL1]|uniref:efflux RND transporter periplasmic adaptor subunit n=1 Tax=Roseimicrobium sp. ORNL1 TaxID=2711231 RepID=UPI0013E174EB|nr:biotin/lipoyl-binding protein [Roseimicrobium sp. ORNL1]QIF05804.1 biotin/lipoyl-binding protein [Roseimicrobium sp. ORNL1]
MKTKGLLLPILSAGLLIYATISVVRSQPNTPRVDPPLPPPRSTFERTVAGIGLVEPSSEIISVSSHLPGVVEKVYVKAGDRVKVGAPLFKLDTRALEAQLAEKEASVTALQASAASAEARVKTASAALKEAKLLLATAEKLTTSRTISADEVTQKRAAVETCEAALESSRAEAEAAHSQARASEAAKNMVSVDLERSTVTALVDGEVLQARIRPGEHATAGAAAQPYLMLGQTQPLHVRVDVDEQDAWRVSPEARAIAQIRGDSTRSTTLKFVRIEPLVVPKQSLTGAAAERVDTRVLQLIYRLEPSAHRFLPGQQVDVFMEELPTGKSSMPQTLATGG